MTRISTSRRVAEVAAVGVSEVVGVVGAVFAVVEAGIVGDTGVAAAGTILTTRLEGRGR